MDQVAVILQLPFAPVPLSVSVNAMESFIPDDPDDKTFEESPVNVTERTEEVGGGPDGAVGSSPQEPIISTRKTQTGTIHLIGMTISPKGLRKLITD